MQDLFETPAKLPKEIQEILFNWCNVDFDYDNIKEFKSQLEAKGYTFEYGLDAEPYDLRELK